jgi:hypothetical protein
VRHQDVTYIKRRLQKSPEAAGKNFMSFICCNYWFVKTFAEPFLNTSATVQTMVHGSTQCIHHSRARLSCNNLQTAVEREEANLSSRYEDEGKGRNTSFAPATSNLLAKILYYTAVFFAYAIILLFIYASFTV